MTEEAVQINGYENMKILTVILAALLALTGLDGSRAIASSNIVTTRHNLSVTGPGEIKALSEARICVFCHTPHNSTPQTPLWNRKLDPVNYVLYSSSTMKASVTQPQGPSRLCLSCHDGTLALGSVLEPRDNIETTGEITSSPGACLGTDISDDHPVSFSYYQALPDENLSPVPPPELVFYGDGFVECSTCHDAHDDSNGNFLRINNIYSGLCVTCHRINGWSGSTHATSPATWTGGGSDPWPNSDLNTVAENGCENCHMPHGAEAGERLLKFREEEQTCFICHNGYVAPGNIEADFSKISHHAVEATAIGLTATHHDPAELPTAVLGHVECMDCHNPHTVTPVDASPPHVNGTQLRVSGVDELGSPRQNALYAYEVCFKCHSENSEVMPYIHRVVDQNNTRLEFATTNPSFHPVISSGRNFDVPSIPSSYMPQLTISSMIYCTDCHDSDSSRRIGGTGPAGPHGSIYRPILRERYETTEYSTESYQTYALCYRCHDRESILNDESFQHPLSGTAGGHSGHVAAGASCSTCHDPHGVQQVPGTGDHTNLINFNTVYVQPVSGYPYPVFNDLGTHSGTCILVCHGRTHDETNSRYP